MLSKSWRRIFLSSAAAAVLLLPAASQAAPRAAHARPVKALDRIAEPAQWLNRIWEAVTVLWQTTTTGGSGQGATGQGVPSDTSTSDSGLSIDPDGGNGG